MDWELIYQQKKMQINKGNILENRNRVDHEYNIGDKFILTNHTAYKYEILYKGQFSITRCFTNGTVNVQYGLIRIRHNILWINTYKSDTKVEDINPKNMCDDVNI